jgi:hypothetical protein
MSADMHIIAFDPTRMSVTDVQEYVLADPLAADSPEAIETILNRQQELSTRLYGGWDAATATDIPSGDVLLDDVWVGQVSWAKAGLFGGEAAFRRYVPRSVEAIQRVYERAGGVIQITPARIPQLTLAFSLPHNSIYERSVGQRGESLPRAGFLRSRGVARARDVKHWLEAHAGAYTFVDSW